MQLAQCPGVKITSQGFVNESNPHRIYHDPSGDGGWKHGIGYQQIEFTLECNAIMDCDPRKRGKTNSAPAYALKANDIKVQGKHELICLFPRSFPYDPIGWGLYFRGKSPQYPNIMNLKEGTGGGYFVSRFSGDTYDLPGVIDGLICIGAASSSAATPIHQLVDNLRNYLLMKDQKLFTPTAQGGNNDGGFDTRLLAHYGMNYDILKKAIDNYSGTTKKRRLGGGQQRRPPRRKLGK